MRFVSIAPFAVFAAVVTLAACGSDAGTGSVATGGNEAGIGSVATGGNEAGIGSIATGSVDGQITSGPGCPTTLGGFHDSCSQQVECTVEFLGACAGKRLTYRCDAPGTGPGQWYALEQGTTRCGCPDQEPAVGSPCDRPNGLECAYEHLPPECPPHGANNVAPFVGRKYYCGRDTEGATTWSRSVHCPYHNDPEFDGGLRTTATPDAGIDAR